ncbi:muts domain V-domain-containing protein [Cristinia sonorae]|uniref:DNA mismatch repair protein MSH3 n=1 Tax=Cristinia sonorae TaxID=1940300 RepID=A0A8K0UYY3_9AGAR|nr:muts domain V-domain-containing protein [Cristinia sonorae]
MSNTRPHKRDQLMISSFFSQPGQGSSTGRRHRSPIDLTDDDPDGTPAKRRKVSSHMDETRYAQTAHNREVVKAPPTTQNFGAAEKYRFEPTSPLRDKGKSKDAGESPRKERLRRILETKRVFHHGSDDTRPDVDDAQGEDTDPEPDEDRAEDIQPGVKKASTFEDTLSFFANAKAKPKATQRTKAAPAKKEIGPSGLPYTPLELQIRELKRQYAGAILMFEVGYKFRFFGEDATVAAKELGIIAFQNRNFLTASIPVHRRDVHLKKLLSQGHKVGLIEQTETAALKKAGETRNELFARKLTRMYTAATYVDQLGSVDDNELASVPPLMCLVEGLLGGMGPDERVSISMIAVSASTGDVTWDQFEDNHMRTELETRMVHISPSELLLPENKLSKSTEKMLTYFTTHSTADHRTRVERCRNLSYSDAFSYITNFYDKQTESDGVHGPSSNELMATISNFPKQVAIALAQCIQYLSDFEVADTLLETRFFSKFTERTHMLLNGNTITNLEIYRNETDYKTKGSLWWILNRSTTKFGARMLRSWIGRPLTDTALLKERTDAVEEILATTSPKLTVLRQLLRGLPDLARGLCRIQYGKCTPQELAVLLPAFNKIATSFNPITSPSEAGFRSRLINDVIYALPKLREPVQELLRAFSLKMAAEGKKGSMWADPDKYPDLDGITASIQIIESELVDELKKVRKVIKKPALQYSTWNGEEYLIEIKKNENREVPVTWSLVSSTKIFRRYRPPAVKAKVEEKARLLEALNIEANRAFQSFLAEISRCHYGVLRDCVNKLSIADCLLSLALVALQEGYSRPTFCDEDLVEIVEGRHPMVETLRDAPFVPNSVSMGGNSPRSKIITGPNMGGKSSVVRMIALCVIMAQIGSYVPARSMRLSVHDGILVRMGASDELARGRSTFMVEMQETSDILQLSTSKTLVILDELGRGTSTFDGMAVASAVLHHLVQHTKCRTLFITHYPQVATDLEREFPDAIQNLHMGFIEDTRIDGTREVAFMYKLAEGVAEESFGIECARLAGVPAMILQVAIDHSEKLRGMIERRIKTNK